MAERFDYAAAAQDAVELVTEFGRDDLVLRSMTDSGDPVRPTRTPVDTTVTGVIVDYADRQIDGTRILMTDRRALISPDAAIAPTDKMQIVEDGEVYEIVRVKTYKPARTVVLYDLQVRR